MKYSVHITQGSPLRLLCLGSGREVHHFRHQTPGRVGPTKVQDKTSSVYGSNDRLTLVSPCAGGVCRLMSPIQSRLHPYFCCQNINLTDQFGSIEMQKSEWNPGRWNGAEERGTISPRWLGGSTKDLTCFKYTESLGRHSPLPTFPSNGQ